MNPKRALFSLFDTTKAEVFAKVLVDHGWQIIASNSTGKYLQDHNIPFIKLADYVSVYEDYGFSPTLHAKVEYNLTSPDVLEDRLELVYIITYPLAENRNDVGGHTILALAAKGKRIPVSSIEDMEKVIAQIDKDGDITPEFREELIKKAYSKVSKHFSCLVNL
jgi:AICAR transformylase/IMP cyclohydrolase PurH